MELTDAERDKLFTYVAGESASMTKEIFMEPWQDLGTYLCFFWKSAFLWAVLSMGSAEYVQSSGDDEALLHMHQVDCDE